MASDWREIKLTATFDMSGFEAGLEKYRQAKLTYARRQRLHRRFSARYMDVIAFLWLIFTYLALRGGMFLFWGFVTLVVIWALVSLFKLRLLV